jgi:hypothetical protein
MVVISDIIMFSCLPSTRIFFNTDFYHDTKSLSSSAQYVTLKNIFHIQVLVIYLENLHP